MFPLLIPDARTLVSNTKDFIITVQSKKNRYVSLAIRATVLDSIGNQIKKQEESQRIIYEYRQNSITRSITNLPETIDSNLRMRLPKVAIPEGVIPNLYMSGNSIYLRKVSESNTCGLPGVDLSALRNGEPLRLIEYELNESLLQ